MHSPLHQRPNSNGMSPECEKFLDNALSIIEQNALNAGKIADWPAFRSTIRSRAGAAQTPPETYEAIQSALEELGDRHSFLSVPIGPLKTEVVWPTAKMLVDSGVAYVVLPSCDPRNEELVQNYAPVLHQKIRELDQHYNPSGWIVDLSKNGGGTMWPMLCGLGPLLGNGDLGYFVDRHGSRTAWGYRNGEAYEGLRTLTKIESPYSLTSKDPRIAVITSGDTSSSGEFVAVSFRGAPNTRSFGQPTYGVPTSNVGFQLSSEATIYLTSAFSQDRTGRIYGESIAPDVLVNGDITEWQKSALTWLKLP